MASDAVKQILTAEALSNKRISAANETADNIIKDAEKYSAVAIQKSISRASGEVEKIRADYMEKFDVHARQSGIECTAKIAEIRSQAEKNMDNAVNAVIKEFF
ncbi:MAG: hypothetical protein K2J40_03200 [Ruminococcus sp.]|nr:hypothetical protein [Ruminococcus sp.]